jgi:hypothetical protein
MARLIAVNAEDTLLPRVRASMGALMLIALGALLFAHNAMPSDMHDSPLHAGLILGSIAAGFGALYGFGDGGRRWARIPAIFFASVAAVALFGSWPWHWIGLGTPLLPVAIIGVGAWLMVRERRWA